MLRVMGAGQDGLRHSRVLAGEIQQSVQRKHS